MFKHNIKRIIEWSILCEASKLLFFFFLSLPLCLPLEYWLGWWRDDLILTQFALSTLFLFVKWKLEMLVCHQLSEWIFVLTKQETLKCWLPVIPSALPYPCKSSPTRWLYFSLLQALCRKQLSSCPSRSGTQCHNVKKLEYQNAVDHRCRCTSRSANNHIDEKQRFISDIISGLTCFTQLLIPFDSLRKVLKSWQFFTTWRTWLNFFSLLPERNY